MIILDSNRDFSKLSILTAINVTTPPIRSPDRTISIRGTVSIPNINQYSINISFIPIEFLGRLL